MPWFTWVFSFRAGTQEHVRASEVPMGKRLTSRIAWFMSRNTFQEYLKAANTLWREASIMSLPCCPPPTPPAEIPPLPASPADCLRQRRAAALCGRCSATCQFLSFLFFFTLRQWTDVQLRFVDIKKTESRCQFVSICCAALTVKSGRSNAETSCRCVRRAPLRCVLTPLLKHDVQPSEGVRWAHGFRKS